MAFRKILLSIDVNDQLRCLSYIACGPPDSALADLAHQSLASFTPGCADRNSVPNVSMCIDACPVKPVPMCAYANPARFDDIFYDHER